MRRLGLAWFHLPVEDDCAPEAPFAAAFASHKADLLARLAAGQTLAIHCRGGSGRTGLMAAILLLESGYPPAEVKALVQGLRPKALTLTLTSTTSTPTTHSPVKENSMTIKVGINGFGRMGRLASRRLRLGGCGVVRINDPAGDAASLAHLITFDSVHGRWHHEASSEGTRW